MLPYMCCYRLLCPECGTLRLAQDLPMGPLAYCPTCQGPRPWTYDLAPILFPGHDAPRTPGAKVAPKAPAVRGL